MRRVLLGALAGAVLAVGCGDEQQPEQKVSGRELAVYVSAPDHGPAARRGRAVVAGVRSAVRDVGGRVDGRRITVVALSSNRPGDRDWDPGTVEANARRAVDDRRAIAYIGEADSGGSAISLPRTNRASLLQVSPADGLTSLTSTPPGKPTAGPARYYPEGKRTFLSLVASDRVVASEMLRLAGATRGRRIALVESSAISERELGGILEVSLLRTGVPPVATEALSDDPGDVRELVDELKAKRPDAILLASGRVPAVDSLLSELSGRLPGVPVVGSPALADMRDSGAGSATAVTGVMPVSLQSPSARRRAGGFGAPEAAEGLYGYDAAALALRALRTAGPDRAGIVRAALRPSSRVGVTGRLEVGRAGARSRPRLAVISVRDGRARAAPTRP